MATTLLPTATASDIASFPARVDVDDRRKELWFRVEELVQEITSFSKNLETYGTSMKDPDSFHLLLLKADAWIKRLAELKTSLKNANWKSGTSLYPSLTVESLNNSLGSTGDSAFLRFKRECVVFEGKYVVDGAAEFLEGAKSRSGKAWRAAEVAKQSIDVCGGHIDTVLQILSGELSRNPTSGPVQAYMKLLQYHRGRITRWILEGAWKDFVSPVKIWEVEEDIEIAKNAMEWVGCLLQSVAQGFEAHQLLKLRSKER